MERRRVRAVLGGATLTLVVGAAVGCGAPDAAVRVSPPQAPPGALAELLPAQLEVPRELSGYRRASPITPVNSEAGEWLGMSGTVPVCFEFIDHAVLFDDARVGRPDLALDYALIGGVGEPGIAGDQYYLVGLVRMPPNEASSMVERYRALVEECRGAALTRPVLDNGEPVLNENGTARESVTTLEVTNLTAALDGVDTQVNFQSVLRAGGGEPQRLLLTTAAAIGDAFVYAVVVRDQQLDTPGSASELAQVLVDRVRKLPAVTGRAA